MNLKTGDFVRHVRLEHEENVYLRDISPDAYRNRDLFEDKRTAPVMRPDTAGREGTPDQFFKLRVLDRSAAISNFRRHWYPLGIVTVPSALRHLSEVMKLLV